MLLQRGHYPLNILRTKDGTNNISTLATKEFKQKAKLDLAATDRAADGNPRATYDITQLPTQYDDNTVVNNPNIGGLVQSRPWTTTP
jgi:hypothetical protein